MKLERLCAEAIDGMTAIEQACFHAPWSAQSFRSAFALGHTVFFGATVGHTLAGYVGMQLLYDEGSITNIGVLPAFRRRGIGEELMRKMIEYAQQNGAARILLEVRESNLAAQRLYARLGFEVLGTRADFYSAPREAARIMCRML